MTCPTGERAAANHFGEATVCTIGLWPRIRHAPERPAKEAASARRRVVLAQPADARKAH